MADDISEAYGRALKARSEVRDEAKHLAAIVKQAADVLSSDPLTWRFDSPSQREQTRRDEMRADLVLDDVGWIEPRAWPTIDALRSVQARYAKAHKEAIAAFDALSPELKKIIPAPSGHPLSVGNRRTRRGW